MLRGHVFFALLGALVCLAADADASAALPSPCICTTEFRPQCGKDGKTYGNPCLASCAKVAVDYAGECKKSCICPLVNFPQCATNGKTYRSPCLLVCAKAKLAHPGPCKKPCICTREFKPQCGKDGKTYGNPCLLKCAKVRLAYAGACKKPCSKTCPMTGPAVCGSDGKTYRNSCVARKCARVGIRWTGKCSELPYIECAPGSPIARCMNPCAKRSPCSGLKNVICLVNPCGIPKTYLGTNISSVEVCGALYVNTASGQVVKKCLPKISGR